ncbi:MAG: hypothetical protein CVU90_15120 [Firmicutes bacterium HGW-Firmicutes-15]|jgi:hypothetical protein|nr:MAG: hypothetical protein CVU90_15120 [Firmicutes bacterium HGW-Firmicutes-15]
MQQIIYAVKDIMNGSRLTLTPTFNADNETIELVLDFTGTDYEAWEKRCDLSMSDGTADILGVSPVVTDVIATFTLTSAHTKKGALVINPYVQLDGKRKGFPKKSVTIESQLNNDNATASVVATIETVIDERLTIKSVTATSVAYGESPTASITQANDGLTVAFGLVEGAKGDKGLSAYEVWLANGNVGTEADYILSLKGAKGDTGEVSLSYLSTNHYNKTEANNLLSAKANKTQEAWTTLSLLNGWVSTSGYTAQYMKDEMGFVHFRGRISSGTSANVFQMPVGLRPTIHQYFIVPDPTNSAAFRRTELLSTGWLQATSSTTLDLASIYYRAEQ